MIVLKIKNEEVKDDMNEGNKKRKKIRDDKKKRVE
jgi:hypothetical protein